MPLLFSLETSVLGTRKGVLPGPLSTTLDPELNLLGIEWAVAVNMHCISIHYYLAAVYQESSILWKQEEQMNGATDTVPQTYSFQYVALLLWDQCW